MVKLVDFGFATFETEEHSTLNLTCGTPSYMAPELYINKLYNAKKVDIWACGVLLYYMLTGSFPFKDKNDADLISSLKNVDYKEELLPSKESIDIIKDIFVKDITLRPNSTQLLNNPWFD